ncbi:MAG: tetratricopeptide repeat protein [Pseudanabaenaceae cyanobacterium bins.39]|nr:tetratricopeptide repeat protein [Pseudanabaenaceae cyanobacterium bins.39]
MNSQNANMQDATIVEGIQFDHYLMVQDPEGSQKILLNAPRYIVGRSPDVEIVLRSQSVSREHATISMLTMEPPLGQLFQITNGTDKGKSTNGITINGNPCDAWVLMDGDEIGFSSNSFAVYHVSPAPAYANDKMGVFLEGLHRMAQRQQQSGKLAEAESYYQQILVLSRQLYGAEHPQIANCLLDLAAIYHGQNLFDRTETYFLQAIAMRQKTLGASHPDVAIAMQELAAIYHVQAMEDRAESMLLQVLQIKQQHLGTEHPEIGASLVDLAEIYAAQKRYQEIKDLYERAIKIYRKSLPPNHPSLIKVQKKLASLNKKLRPRWMSRSILIPLSLVTVCGVIIYIFFASKNDLPCIKVMPDGTTKSISGDECRRISN